MSVLVVGLSHRTTPVSVLERASLTADAVGKLLQDRRRGDRVAEAAVLATCNRSSSTPTWTSSTAASPSVSELLARHSGVRPRGAHPAPVRALRGPGRPRTCSRWPAGWTRWSSARARSSARSRPPCALAQDARHAGRLLNELVQQALRVGKRGAHRDRHRPAPASRWSTVGLDAGRPRCSAASPAGGRWSSAPARWARWPPPRCSGPGWREIVGRQPDPERARAAGRAPPAGRRGCRSPKLARAALADADVVVSCTGAAGLVLAADRRRRGQPRRAGRPLLCSTWPCPRDIDPAVRELAGVSLVDLEPLASVWPATRPPPTSKPGPRDRRRRGGRPSWPPSAPRASRRPWSPCAHGRRGGRGRAGPARRPAARARRASSASEIAQTVRRVVDKLLHAPTVRVKELAGEPGGAGVRGRAARAVRPRPGDGGRGHPGRSAEDGAEDERDRRRPGVRRCGSAPGAARWPWPSPGRWPTAVTGGPAGCPSSWSRSPRTGTPPASRSRQIGGTGVFVTALREALLAGEVDFAVHSLKDLPTAQPDELVLAAVPLREDPRDVLVARDGLTLARAAARRPDRHRFAAAGRAAARRSATGWTWSADPRQRRHPDRIRTERGAGRRGAGRGRAEPARPARRGDRVPRLDPDAARPRPGGPGGRVPRRHGRPGIEPPRCCAGLDDPRTRAAVTAERSLLAALEAGCCAPVGALADLPGRRQVAMSCACAASSARPTARASVQLSTTGPVPDDAGGARPRTRGRDARRGCGRSDGGASPLSPTTKNSVRSSTCRPSQRPGPGEEAARFGRLRRRRSRRPRPADPAGRRGARRRGRARRRHA